MAMSTQSKLYLAGPMTVTGRLDLNAPAFATAEEYLTQIGYEVFNPAADTTLDKTYRACLKTDLNWILDHAEVIALLPGWELSPGARTEKALADALGLEVKYL